jgi:hypothetical protein
MSGNPLDDVALCYREPLPVEVTEYLKIHFIENREKDVHVVLPILRDLMINQLTVPRWSPDASLKMYLSYCEGMNEEEYEWFDNSFPDLLQLRHAYQTYSFLTLEK